MSQADLYLIRHGQTDWNACRRMQGLQETDLNDTGRMQAEEAGRKFSGRSIAAIYSSPMARAKQTAEIIHCHQNCPLHFDPSLREASMGELEGSTEEEFLQGHAARIEEYRSLSLEKKWGYRFAAGWETISEVAERVHPSFSRIAKRHLGEAVIVVTHGKVLKTVLAVHGRIDTQHVFIPNGGVLHVRTDGALYEIVNHEGIAL